MEHIYLEAPNKLSYTELQAAGTTIFLGGSITGAWNWQEVAKKTLLPHFSIFNPRRWNYVKTPGEERIQITWEYTYLNWSSIVLFYFSHETLAPITLFELGAILEKKKNEQPWKRIYVCIHPDYQRKEDVIIQTELRDKQIAADITFDLDKTLQKIIDQNWH